MTQNTFFNFIQNIQFSGPEKFKKINKIELKKDTKSIPYFLIQSPIETQTIINNIILKEQHLSIFSEHPTNLQEEEYHYTAFFRDSENKKWRLHIYFNAMDNLINQPVLELESNGIYKKQNITGLTDMFLQLAEASCNKFIQPLRTLQNQTINELEKQQECNWEAIRKFKVNTLLDKKAFETLIADQIKIIMLLRSLAYNPLYRKTDVYSSRIKYLEELKLTVTPTPIDSTNTKEEHKESPTNNTTGTPQKKSKQKTKSKPKKKKEASIFPLEKFKKTITDNKFNDDNQHIDWKKLNELILDMRDSITWLDSDYMVTQETLMEFNILQEDMEALAKKQLLSCLQNHNLTEAKKLDSVIPMVLTANAINEFLVTFNSENLDFALQYDKGFNLNALQPKDNDKQFVTIGEFINNKAKTANKEELSKLINCIEVLLKHNMSPLLDDGEGFPFVYKAMMEDNHPLRDWFYNRPKIIISNYQIFSQFVTLLELKQNTLNPTTLFSKDFSEQLDFFRENLKYYRQHHNEPTQDFIKSMFEFYLSFFYLLDLKEGLRFTKDKTILLTIKKLSDIFKNRQTPVANKLRVTSGRIDNIIKTNFSAMIRSQKLNNKSNADIINELLISFPLVVNKLEADFNTTQKPSNKSIFSPTTNTPKNHSHSSDGPCPCCAESLSNSIEHNLNHTITPSKEEEEDISKLSL